MKNIKKGMLIFCVFLASFLFFLIPLGAKTQGLDSPFGINAFVLNRYNWKEWDVPLSNIKAMGASWTREEFVWKQIEPEKGKYNWEFYDNAFAKINEAGINILGIIDYSAPWATEDPNRVDSDKYMPNLDEWKNYVGKVVDRYGNKVKYWQIWNEPNLSIFFKPEPDASKYTLLLKAAYEVIKSKDSESKILMGGLSGVDTGYMGQLKKNGAEEYFDILAFHPYRFDFKSPPEDGLISDLEKIKKISNDFGGKKIWFTEFGWPTENGSSVNQELQADYLLRTYLLSLTSPLVEKIFWYDLRDDGSNINYLEHNFGLLKRDFTKKKSYLAYQNMTNLLVGAKVEKFNFNNPNNIYDIAFLNNKKIRVVWKTTGEDIINIEDKLKSIKVFSSTGEIIQDESEVQKSIKISSSPVFIVDYKNALNEIYYGQTLDYEYVSQSPFISLKNEEEKEVWLKIKNTGTAIWRNDGPNPLSLGTFRQMDRNSSFYSDKVWLASNRPARMLEGSVKKGEIATFIFRIKANQVNNGFYKEYFCPLIEGVSWMKDIGIYWGVEVNDLGNEDISKNTSEYSYQILDQTSNPILLENGKKQVVLKLKNTGSKNWEKGIFNLGTARIKDRSSIFNKDWKYDNRILLDQDLVRPGEVGSFTFNFTSSEFKGVLKEYFRPVVDGYGWLTDIGIYWKVVSN